MIVFSQKPRSTRGKTDSTVYKVTAYPLEDWSRLIEFLNLEEPGSFYSRWPFEEWKSPLFKVQSKPEIFVRPALLSKLVNELGAVELPDAYFDIVTLKAKQMLWQEQGIAVNHGWEYGEASDYFRKKEHWLYHTLGKSEDLVRDVESHQPWVQCDEVELGWVIKTIHYWIENFDLGQRRRLNLNLLSGEEKAGLYWDQAQEESGETTS